MTRRGSALYIFLCATLFISACAEHQPDSKDNQDMKPIPVVLDTDIGTDIDDTWALAMLLKSPELDLKMVLTDTGNTAYRARLTAKLLEVAHRTDVPVAIGLPFEESQRDLQAEWVRGYNLANYPGKVHQDGVQAFIDLVMASPDKITLIAISPTPNLAAALEREPRIAKKLRFVGMFGSVYKGYGGKETPEAEWNVKSHNEACRKVFQADWGMTITPLDTCGMVRLTGDLYRKVRESKDPLIQALMENYRIWAKIVPWEPGLDPESTSSTLFDTVAVYLAFSEKGIQMKEMGIQVTEDGFTKVDEKAKKMKVAVDWEDFEAFKDFLVKRLIGEI